MTDMTKVKHVLRSQRIETPVLGVRQLRAPGSRCSRSRACRAPRTRRSTTPPRCTGSPGSRRPSPLHIPWDKVDDYAELAAYAAEPGRGARQRSTPTSSRTTTTSSAASPTRTRASAARRSTTCSSASTSWTPPGSRDLKLWFADGTNYPGQDDIRGAAGPARRGAARGLRAARPTTSGCCWSTSSSSPPSTPPTCRTGARRTRTASSSGRRRRSCVDTGHHAPGTNIEFIVAFLLRAGKLGAFDFNSRFYADDDLMVGAADPFQLFRIMHEVVRGGALGAGSGRRLHARPVPQHRGRRSPARSAR